MVATMQSGALVSDSVVNEMVKERLSEADAARGFILDGYPRTLDQAGTWRRGWRGGESARW
jgi:adenylate kinase